MYADPDTGTVEARYITAPDGVDPATVLDSGTITDGLIALSFPASHLGEGVTIGLFNAALTDSPASEPFGVYGRHHYPTPTFSCAESDTITSSAPSGGGAGTPQGDFVQYGEGVLDGLARLHPWFAPALLIAAVVMSHVYLSYMTVGTAEVCRNLVNPLLPENLRYEPIWPWAVFWNAVALWLVFRPSYDVLEFIFKIFLAVLSVSFIGCALWVGFNPGDLAAGLFRLEMPDHRSVHDPKLVAAAMIGALRSAKLFDGYRGAPTVSRSALADLLVRVGALADDLSEVAELDLNPVICRGDQLVVVDARIRVAAAPVKPDPALRQLR